jgi:hypothetical protein
MGIGLRMWKSQKVDFQLTQITRFLKLKRYDQNYYYLGIIFPFYQDFVFFSSPDQRRGFFAVWSVFAILRLDQLFYQTSFTILDLANQLFDLWFVFSSR